MLDKETGALTPVRHEALPARGACAPIGGQTFCLYEEDSRLFLQFGIRRWAIEPAVALNYAHDFDRKMTTFDIGDFRIEYAAWWSDDPAFNKFIPEEDEDFDFLAYVYRLWQDEARRQDLIRRWALGA